MKKRMSIFALALAMIVSLSCVALPAQAASSVAKQLYGYSSNTAGGYYVFGGDLKINVEKEEAESFEVGFAGSGYENNFQSNVGWYIDSTEFLKTNPYLIIEFEKGEGSADKGALFNVSASWVGLPGGEGHRKVSEDMRVNSLEDGIACVEVYSGLSLNDQLVGEYGAYVWIYKMFRTDDETTMDTMKIKKVYLSPTPYEAGQGSADEGTNNGGSQNGNEDTNTNKPAPDTGDVAGMGIAVAVLGVAAAGMVVASKRKK